jgi:hypothetical protein
MSLPEGPPIALDASVPGVTAAELPGIIRWEKGTVHLKWSAVVRRVTLLYLYDTLHSHGVAVAPNKAEAVAGWTELRRGEEGALVPLASREIALGGGGPPAVPNNRPLVLGPTGFDVLLVQSEESAYINHVWVICTQLRFPLDRFECLHANIAAELFERVSKLERPHCFVQSYRYKDQVLPLLMWYRISEREVAYMLQEYLHVRHRHIPEARVWNWQILPSQSNLNLVGAAFAQAGLYPSWSMIARYAAGGDGPGRLAPAAAARLDVAAYAGRPDGDAAMHVEYDRGVTAFWIGEEVFFAVECRGEASMAPAEGGARHPLANLRIPDSPQELPPWVAGLLLERSPGLEIHGANANLQRFLSWFASTHGGAAVRLLRSINWPLLPLVWRPLFFKDIPVRTTSHESADAQTTLVKSVAAVWEDAETLAEAIEQLHQMTGVSL